MEKSTRDDILARKHWVFDLDGTLTVAIHDFAHIRNVLGVPHGVDILGHLGDLPEAEALVARENCAGSRRNWRRGRSLRSALWGWCNC
jgi:hypothetical protein